MKLKEQKLCSLCRAEMTDLAILVYEDVKPLCLRCIKFIKKTKLKDLERD